MKTTITPQADAVRPLKPELDAQPSNRACEPCPNCGAKWFDDQLREIRDIFERVAAGEPMPAGECPECGALCHLAESQPFTIEQVLANLVAFDAQLSRFKESNGSGPGWVRMIAAQIVARGIEPARRVLIEVTGGCAAVTTCPPGVEVEIVDHDNEKVGH